MTSRHTPFDPPQAESCELRVVEVKPTTTTLRPVGWAFWGPELGWFSLLILSIALALFLRLGDVPLFDLDEGAFAQATLEMVHSGHYLSTSLDGEPRYDKPIFSYWMQAVAVHWLGPTELAFRLPSAFAASLWVLVVFQFAREQMGVAGGAAAGLLLVFALGPMIIGRAATADAWLNLWLTLAFVDWARWHGQPRRSAPLLRAYLWMGLGFLTKGPVAVVIPLLASTVYLWSAWRWRDWLRSVLNPWAWLVFALVAVPWYIMILWQEGTGFFYGFFISHNLDRFLETRSGHGGVVWYYLVVLPLVVSPFAGWVLSTLGRLRHWPQAWERFAWIWFFLVFGLVSVSSTQLPHYVIYGLTPLLLLLALQREQLKRPWLAFLPVVVIFALFLLWPWLLHVATHFLQRPYDLALAQRGIAIFDVQYSLIALAFMGVVVLIIRLLRWAIWQRLLLLGALQALFMTAVFIPAAGEMQQTPVKVAAELARELPGTVVAFDVRMPSFSVYRGAPTPRRMPEPGEWAFTRIQGVEVIAATYPDQTIEILFQEGGIALVWVPSTR